MFAGISQLYSRELEVAERLARAAGAVAARYHGTDLEVMHKPGDEPVTVADREASEVVVAGLREAFPDDVVISEENPDDLSRLERSRVWYVDPIDGTKDFIRGEDGYCVMIGLVIDHDPTVGVLYQPTHDRAFAAAPGDGAWFSAPGEPLRRLHTSDIDDPKLARLVASKSNRTPEIDQVKSALGISSEVNVGSIGLKLGLIALAERDLYVNPSSRCSSWDTAGPEAILREAGGRLTDLHGRPLRYDKDTNKHRGGLLASNGPLHDMTVARLSPLFPG